MEAPVKVAVYGLGPIGRRVVAMAARKSSLKLVGAVDNSPAIAGRALADVVAGVGLGAPVAKSLAELLARCSPEVVLHATGSRLAQVYSQFNELIDRELNVVSTCEEASYPASDEAESLTADLDRLCRDRGVRLLATGVNPGFAMDVWPLLATAVHGECRRVWVHRVVDAASRREPLQRKIGAGLSREEFGRLVAAGAIGHVGLQSSAFMLAAGLRSQVVSLTESIEPVMAKQTVQTQYMAVQAGQVAGLRQELVCELSGGTELELRLEMYLGAPDPHDEVSVEGDIRTAIRVPGGFPGDQATAAVVTNVVGRLLRCQPGYRTMLDLPLFGCLP